MLCHLLVQKPSEGLSLAVICAVQLCLVLRGGSTLALLGSGLRMFGGFQWKMSLHWAIESY